MEFTDRAVVKSVKLTTLISESSIVDMLGLVGFENVESKIPEDKKPSDLLKVFFTMNQDVVEQYFKPYIRKMIPDYGVFQSIPYFRDFASFTLENIVVEKKTT